MEVAEALITVAQVAAGGTIVQGVMAWVRRRSELRQLDRQSDSVAVSTAEHVIGLLRAELDLAKKDADVRQQQIQMLAEEVSRLRTELVVTRAALPRQIEGGRGE